MTEKSYIVEGFCFKTEAEAENARNEQKGVEYMKKQINYNNLSASLSAYNMMNDKRIFKTPVGISFMYEVRKHIIDNGVLEEDIPPINVDISGSVTSTKKKDVESVYKSRFINMIIVNVALIITIILFIIIVNNSENLNIINYQKRIDAQYKDMEDNLSKWSIELKNKEEELKEKEKELGLR